MFSNALKIPKDRIAVLIGKHGEVKTELEEATGTKLIIDSTEGDVIIESEDSMQIFIVTDIIKAIARGFNPQIARLLLKQDYLFEIIDVSEYTKSKDSMQRLKGRVIGHDGKARGTIERSTETYISVYGKTICIIGRAEQAGFARKAIEMLLEGGTHTSIFKWLERKNVELKKKDLVDPGF